MTVKVYLAGAIDSNKEDKCREWRNYATWRLEDCGAVVSNPIKGKELSQDYSAEEIVSDDLRMIFDSTVILAEIGVISECYPYIGTSMEIMYANLHSIPVYCWSGVEGNLFLDHHTKFQSNSLEENIQKIKEDYGLNETE